MPIQVNLQELMIRNDVSETQLAQKAQMTKESLSKLKKGRSKSIRFSALDTLCKALNCQPGDILQYTNVRSIK